MNLQDLKNIIPPNQYIIIKEYNGDRHKWVIYDRFEWSQLKNFDGEIKKLIAYGNFLVIEVLLS